MAKRIKKTKPTIVVPQGKPLVEVLVPKIIAAVQRQSDPNTRLRIGDIFTQSGQEYAVLFVNESRAAVAQTGFNIKPDLDPAGHILRFNAEKTENISPNSEVHITHSLGRAGLLPYLNRFQHKDAPTEGKPLINDPEPKVRGLGEHLGHSVSAIIRAMGANGWTRDEARDYWRAVGIVVSNGTIAAKIADAKAGDGQFTRDKFAIPQLTKEQLKEMRSKIK